MDTKSVSSNKQTFNRNAFFFILVTVFLTTMGFGLISPVAPFIITRYVDDPNQVGLAVGWLTSSYAICQFIAAPGLGVLSDYFGRKPILLLTLLGSAIGYLLFGVGGSLWILFLSRIIDGITGGNISVAIAYISDSSTPENRAKLFGWIGVISGIGFILGPAIGGVVSRVSYEAPVYVAAFITFLNIAYGFFFMPETLEPESRIKQITISMLNPFGVLRKTIMLPALRLLFVALFLYNLPYAFLQSNISLFSRDSLGWNADSVGVMLGVAGFATILSQGILLQFLLRRFGEQRIVIISLCLQFISYILISVISIASTPLMLILANIIIAGSNGLIVASFSSILSSAADSQSQGQVHGASQSVQSLSRIVGPLIGGQVYVQYPIGFSYLASAGAIVIALGSSIKAFTSKPHDVEALSD